MYYADKKEVYVIYINEDGKYSYRKEKFIEYVKGDYVCTINMTNKTKKYNEIYFTKNKVLDKIKELKVDNLFSTWKAVQILSEYNYLVFRAIMIPIRKNKEKYYMITEKLYNTTFIRYFRLNNDDTIAYLKAIPLDDEIKWILTNDIDLNKIYKVQND